ncbi:hypothetical protein ES703_96693 [subsurface metagenome]
MGLFAKIAGFIGGSTVKTIADTVKAYFPPSMSEKEKADLSLKISQVEHAREVQLLTLANEADEVFNRRIRDMEGTAADLKTVPIIGHVIIFARGCQRPAFGIFTLIMDYQVMSGAWELELQSPKGIAFVVINILVLTFLFGERAIKNVMPLILNFFFAKKGKTNKA